MGIKEGDTVKTAAAGDQFPLLADHIIADQKDFSSFQSLSGSHFFLLFFHLSIQDTYSPAAVPEDSDPF